MSRRDTRGWRSAAPRCDTGRGRRLSAHPRRHRRQEAAPAVPRRSILHARDPQVGIRQGELRRGYFGIRFGAMVFVNWWG